MPKRRYPTKRLERDTPLQVTAVINDSGGYTNVRRLYYVSGDIVPTVEAGAELHTIDQRATDGQSG